MTLKEKISTSFSRAADTYEAAAVLQKKAAEKVVEISKQHMPENARILDLGSGTGFIGQSLGRTIVQVDISFLMSVKSALSNPVMNADIENLPVKDASIDMVLSSSALQWCADLKKPFAEINRVLKPEGYFCFSTFGTKTLKELKTSFEKAGAKSKVLGFHTSDQIATQLEKSGFYITHLEEDIQKMLHPRLLSLLQSIKDIGATATSEGSSDNISKEKLYEIQDIYKQKHSEEGGIYSSWEILYFIARKK